jgi:signal transduction histidine kinase/CheY-like chemotaxis protein
MNTFNALLILLGNLIVLSIWQALWFKIVALSVCAIAALIFHKVRINSLRVQKGELQRKLDERNELLNYSTDREKKAHEEAALANRTKSEILAKISREIRTPMNGVIGMASLLKETSLNPEQQEYSETIRTCGESLLSVINDILLDDVLAYSKVESGKNGLDQKDFDLGNSIEEVLEVFGSKAAHAKVELVYQMDSDVPQQIVGDNSRFRQVLMNLMENAVKFTSHGEIMVKVALASPRIADSLELEVAVSDTGSGIAADKLKLFSSDISNDESAEMKGSGLGLVICKRLIGLMGGRMEIKSELGKGTTVKFSLSAKVSPVLSRVNVYNDMAGLEGKQILIVDDNLASGQAIKSRLEHWKLVPTLAGSAAQALDILSVNKDFDLVLSDMQMTGMNGIGLAEVIQKQYTDVPVVLMATEGDESYNQRPELFSSMLPKPIRQHMLSKHLLSALRQVKVSTEDNTHKLSTEFAKKYPLKILIAEDNRVNQKLAMRVLTKLGYNPDIAEDGKEVLEEVSQLNYDLILMDVQMPEMDGLEATRMIRLCLSVQPVIVAMTANTMQGDREDCLRAGMDDYISKPVHINELVIILEKWALQVKAKQ